MEIYVLDGNLDKVAVIDCYKSLIWARRYVEAGDCELYAAATADYVAVLKEGYYLSRKDDNMICRIKRVEIDTDVENGDYIVVNGVDAKSYLDQRIIWGTETCKGRAEAFLHRIVEKTLINADITARNLLKPNGGYLMRYTQPAGFKKNASQQMSYVNVGEKVREFCRMFGWGYKVFVSYINGVPFLEFGIYQGKNRRNSVVFSPQFENLAESRYVLDLTNMGNVALCAGDGEGAARTKMSVGMGAGADRYELFVDAKDLSREVTYAELTTAYPGGTIASRSAGYGYVLATLDVQIISEEHYVWLVEHYSGSVVTVDETEYFRISNVEIASVPSAAPAADDIANLYDVVYIPYLLTRGEEKLAEYGMTETFEGSVIPDVTFRYRKDYDLGDIVTIRNSYGFGQAVRITEVIEVDDEDGFRIEPTFENVR